MFDTFGSLLYMYSLIFPYAQVIAFVEVLLRNESTNIRKVAIIVPVNTLENWKMNL